MNNEVITDTDGKKFEESGGLIKPLNYEQNVEEKTSTPPSQNDIDLNQFQESLYPTNVNNLQPGEVAPSFVVAQNKWQVQDTNQNSERTVKQNHWDDPNKIKENFTTLEEGMKDSDAKRYSDVQETGISQAKENSITTESKVYKKYQEQNGLPANGDTETEAPMQKLREDILNQENNQTTEEAEEVPQGEVLDNNAIEDLRKSMVENDNNTRNEDPVTEELRAENAKLEGRLEEDRSHILQLKDQIEELKNQLTTLMEQINSEHEDVTNPQPENLDQEPLITPPPTPIEATPEVIVNEPPQETTPTQEPVIIDGEFQGEPVTPPTQEATAQGSDARVAALEAQLRELRGENTPEQRSAALAAEILKLEEKLQEEGSLTDAEKVRYIELTMEKKDIDKGLVQAGIENNKSTERKEKLIKRIAFVAGAGLALATPAVGVAAIVAVTLGGRFVGNTVKKASNNLMSKSTSLKYESRKEKTLQELNELDKKIKRNEWWSKRLGEASAVIIGGSTGYGIGSTFQSIFGWGASSASVAPDTNSPIDLTSQTSVSHSPVVPEGSIELPTGTGGAETLNEGVLVNNGRIDLPGSAWNGNLAQTNAQDVLQGGALNPSNYTGGIHEMAPNFLERDLIANGITRPELMNNLDTSQIHQLLNRYFSAVQGGNTQPDLAQILESIKPGVSEALIK